MMMGGDGGESEHCKGDTVASNSKKVNQNIASHSPDL